MKHLLLLAATLTVATGAAQALTVAPINGAVQVTAFVSDSNGSQTALNSDASGFSGAPTALSAATIATWDSGGDSLSSHGAVAAVWTSATAGFVQMRNFGWNSSSNIAGGASVNGGGPNWSYTFTPSTNATYTMTYNITGSGNTFGLWGFYNAVNGIPDYSNIDPFNPNSSGTYTAALTGGTTYNVALYNNANAGVGPGTISTLQGDFSWSITGATVPEPASWAMLIAGFGMVGGTLRTRRRVIA